jgi:uncharacterized protein (TIGR03435 family)
MAAYHLTPRAVVGGAPWTHSEHYDITAATPGEIRPNLDQQKSMLRSLLADRFKLTFHREQKELPLDALVIEKGGPRMKESTMPSDANPVLINRIFPGRVLLPARNATMEQFAAMMQRAVIDRPIVDRTGLTGRYDFDLEWTPDESQFGGQVPAGAGDPPSKPDLFAALREQLGLRLEATKGPVQVLVIDQAKLPVEN